MLLFDYHRPSTLAETAALVAELGEEAQLLAGGTSLVTLARLGLAEPGHAIALGGVPELHGVQALPDGGLQLGAMTSIREAESSPVVRERAAGLAEAAGAVATVRIRNQATVGGTLVHADPNQDVPPMLMVHDAVVHLAGPAGSRAVPVSDLFLGFFETVLEPDEVLTSVVLPPPAAVLRTGYLKFLPRTNDDYATVAVAAGLAVDDGRVTSARVAVAGGGSVPLRCTAAEQALQGLRLRTATELEDAAALVRDALDPISDARGSAGYKKEMARVCTARLLRRLAPEVPA